jgi:hypothetical protein
MSYWFAEQHVVIASTCAFLAGESIEWAIYTFSGKPFAQRILTSSLLSIPVDTIIFLYLINQLNSAGVLVMILAKSVGVMAVWLRARNFNFDAPVLIIMEGNWMWMDDSEVEKIFKLIHNEFANFTLVFDYADNALVEKEKSKNMWIEPKTGIEDINAFASRLGFVVKENTTNLELKSVYELTGDAYTPTRGYGFCTLTKTP